MNTDQHDNRRLLWVRAGWWSILLLGLGTFIASLPPYITALQTVCEGCSAPYLTPGNLQDLQALGLSTGFWVAHNLIYVLVPMLVWLLLGIVIFLRRSDDAVAILFSSIMMIQGFAGNTSPFNVLVAAAPAWWLPTRSLEYLASTSIFLMVYLFPNGRLIPRWTRWLALLWLLVQIPATFMRGSGFFLDYNTWPMWLVGLLFIFFVLSLPIAQGYRYLRISTPVERQQTKWALYGIFAMAGTFLLFSISAIIFPQLGDSDTLSWGYFIGGVWLMIVFTVLPIAIGIAILRSRLWDIDVIIRRTLVYSVLTITLALVYFGGVALLQSLVETVSGQGSPAAIVISTLVIAALFTPLRRRVQDAIDRRFYRRKYNAEQALADFSLAARNDTDLESLTAQVVDIVNTTIQPEVLSLWLKAASGFSSDQTMPNYYQSRSTAEVTIDKDINLG